MQQSTARPKVESLQVLRALAATLVLVAHTARDVMPMVSETAPGFSIQKGGQFGVDIFFVISGFIMIFVAMANPAKPPRPGNFLLRRVIRVVPLYWLFTTLTVIISVVGAGLKNHSDLGLGYILGSYFFIPVLRPDGHLTPALGVGWTLNYEMFFYAVFAIAIALQGREAWRVAIPAIVGLVLVGTLLSPDVLLPWYWSRPILLEFAAGMALGYGFLRGWRLPWPVAFLTMAVGWVWWYIGTGVPDPTATELRLLVWGLPAILIVSGCMLSRLPVDGLLPDKLRTLVVKVGDCSYSTYLIHMFAIRVLVLGSGRLLPSLLKAEVLAITLFCIIATLVAWLCHVMLEKPMTEWIDRKFARA